MLTLGCFRGIVPSPPGVHFSRRRSYAYERRRRRRGPSGPPRLDAFRSSRCHLRVFVSHIHRPSHICDDDHCQSDIDDSSHQDVSNILVIDGGSSFRGTTAVASSTNDACELHRGGIGRTTSTSMAKNGGGGGNGGGIAMSTYELLALAVGRVRDRVSYVRHAGHALRMRAARAMSSSSSSSSSTSPAGCR